MLRPLVMDFRGDPKARDIGDEYMFGPAFLASPVTVYLARSRPVYLPEGATWYDFWTGRSMAGGRTIEAPAPYDAMPVHVRAGSIVPLGPELQYTDEKPADPITLYVYAGADGHFTLYEDDGVSYAYERGQFSRIPLSWDDAAGVLTVGRREGQYPGMLDSRTFHVVLVSPSSPVGPWVPPAAPATVTYRGEAVTVDLTGRR